MRLRDPWNSTKILRDPEFLNLTFATPITVSIVMTMMMIMIISQEEVYGGANTSPDVRLDIVARGLWERQRAAFLDVRVCHPNAVTLVGGFHVTSVKFKLQNYWSSYDFTFMMYKSSWKHIHTNFCSEWVLGFVIDYAWISKLLRDVGFTWRPKELLCWLKKRLHYFEEFGYLSSSCIGKRIILMFLSSSRDKFTLL